MAIPVGVALGIAAMIGMVMSGMDLGMFIQRLFNTYDSFPLLAVPFFILAGDIMQQGTIANSLLHFCRSIIGHIRGGLSHVSVITCLFYGALSGSAPATTAAVGGIMIPAMEKEGYPKSYAAAINTAGGCLGVIIPPSVPLILYGSTVGCSISDLFLAGIIPGVIIGIVFILMGFYTCSRKNYGVKHKKQSYKEMLKALWNARYALLVPIIVLGGIYGGITTPTEAGCVAVVYAMFVEVFITRSMTLAKFKNILFCSLRTTGVIFFIIATANALSIVLVYCNAHEMLCHLITSISTNPLVIILILTVVFLILGTFVETAVTILVVAPMLMPLLNVIGMTQVQFGLFMLVILATGFLTPPVGLNLFVACGIANLPLATLAYRCLPYCLAMCLVGLAIALIPAITMFLI
jgi:C4-dicarboxylate transporter DctM subunit